MAPLLLFVLGCIQQSDAQNEIARLIRQLGAEDFADREKAMEDISNHGRKAYPALLGSSRSPDLEIARRCRQLFQVIGGFRSGDVLLIKVTGDTSFEQRVNLSENGTGVLRTVGEIMMAGKTRIEIQELIRERIFMRCKDVSIMRLPERILWDARWGNLIDPEDPWGIHSSD